MVDGIQQQIVSHGDLITQETTRIVEAMQGYVQGGVEAVGQLAQRVDAQIHTIGGLDDTAIERVREAVRTEVEETFAGQLDQVYERIGLQGREVRQASLASETRWSSGCTASRSSCDPTRRRSAP